MIIDSKQRSFNKPCNIGGFSILAKNSKILVYLINSIFLVPVTYYLSFIELYLFTFLETTETTESGCAIMSNTIKCQH